MSKKKKIIISVAMVLLLAATAYLNISLNNIGKDEGGSGIPVGNFFSEYRTERVQTREQEMLYLDSIISNSSLSSETVQTAVDQKLALVKAMETELVLEGLIKAKGFDDVAVTMASGSDNINVIVKSSELTQDQVAQIYNVLVSEMDVKQGNVKILPIE